MTPSLGKAAGLVEENSLLTALLSGQNGGGGQVCIVYVCMDQEKL